MTAGHFKELFAGALRSASDVKAARSTRISMARLASFVLREAGPNVDERNVGDLFRAMGASLDCAPVIAVLGRSLIDTAEPHRLVQPLQRLSERAHRERRVDALEQLLLVLLRLGTPIEGPIDHWASAVVESLARSRARRAIRLIERWLRSSESAAAGVAALLTRRPGIAEQLSTEALVRLVRSASSPQLWRLLARRDERQRQRPHDVRLNADAAASLSEAVAVEEDGRARVVLAGWLVAVVSSARTKANLAGRAERLEKEEARRGRRAP